MSSPVATAVEVPETESAPVTGRDVAVIAGTAALWGVVMFAAARSAGFDFWATSSWGRWDTGHYLSIADSGYVYERCVGVANRGPDDWCGNAGWFPLYPYTMRVGSWFGPGPESVGRAVSLIAMVGAWAALWLGFLRRRPAVAGFLGMALAAVFPASVYYGAVFPIALVVWAMMSAIVFVDRQRWLLAGCCGAVAAMAYTSGFVVIVISLIPLTAASVGDLRARFRAAAAVAGPIVIGYLAVLANFQRDVGAWDAAVNTQASYNFQPAFPLVTIWRQAEKLTDDIHPGVIGVQTILVAGTVIVALFVAYRSRTELSLGERAAAVLVAALWLSPLTLGGDLSLYRAESLLLPVVILLSRLPVPALAIAGAACVPVGFAIARLFFNATLI